jgi:hypothetical protein
MKGRALLILIGVMALVVAAPEVAAAKAGGTDRPARGKGSGTTTFDTSTVPFAATNQGTARIAHLGNTTYSSDYTITPGAGGTFSVAGTTEFVAANGHRLFTEFTGSGHGTGPTTSEATVHGTITGGTGRFEGASGSLTTDVLTETTSVVGTTVTANQTTTSRGTISY